MGKRDEVENKPYQERGDVTVDKEIKRQSKMVMWGADQESLLDLTPAGSSEPPFQQGFNLGRYKLQTLNTNDFVHPAVPLLIAHSHIPRMKC